MTNLTTQAHSLHTARQMLESISEVANTAYYVYTGVHIANDDELNDSTLTFNNAYRNMIQGKRVTASDATLMIRNVPYETNKVYDMYDDTVELAGRDYYAIVNAGSFYHAYKCLDNNNGANSIYQPDFSHISGANTQVYQTADGYRWKYMYSISSAEKLQFATSDYFPCGSNATVTSQAVDQVLDIVKVEGTGRGYHNYLTGTFASVDLRIDGDLTIYALSNPNASVVDGFYHNCLIYISGGTGVGSYATIVDYFSNDDGNFIQLDNPFQVAPLNGSSYEIYPAVLITGSSGNTVNVVARALVNSSGSNSIYRVEVLDRGGGFDRFVANVQANAAVGVSAVAELRPIQAPFGGHGFDPASELGATRLCMSVKFSNTEGGTILATNDFRQIGLIKDPLFANVNLKLDSVIGAFLDGEEVCKITPLRFDTSATINTTSTHLSSNDADFEAQVTVGDYLYLQSNDGLSHQLAEVATVSNSSLILLESNGLWSCTATKVYQANVSTTCYVESIEGSTNVNVTNVAGIFSTGDLIIGHSSGAKAVINTIMRNEVTKDFSTFVQLYKYIGELESGTFLTEELVYQNSLSDANAYVHSATIDGSNVTIYTSNQVGTFEVGGANTIVGNTSGAVMTPSAKYTPELVFGSGKVLYMENIDPVTRDPAQSETVKMIF